MSELEIEVVFALAERQSLLTVKVPSGSTVANALDACGIARIYPEIDLGQLPVGIWGRIVAREHVLGPGDRVELYRPLALDPREARRQLALSGQTMGHAQKD